MLGMLLNTQTPRFKFPFFVVLSIIAIMIWIVLRFVLWIEVGLIQLSFSETLRVWAYGAWFDISALCFLIVPWLLISTVLPAKLKNKTWVNKLRFITLFLMVFALLFGAVSEYIFWQEFTTRFNFIAVDYLIYTHEVIGNIQESYPVPLILLAIAIVALLIVWGVRQLIMFDTAPLQTAQKLKRLALAIALPLFSFQFANLDQMSFGKNAYANELSGNGVFSFAAAARRNELDYDKFYKTIPQAEANAILAKNGLERRPFSEVMNDSEAHAEESIEIGPFMRRPKNVILISVESLSAEYMGIYGNKENLTPYLDKLAKQSLVFDKIFATGTRTVRGLDALSLGLPPIPGQAIVHRPNNEHLATIGTKLSTLGYNTYWIYGGYGVFDNMNNYFRGNDYKVVDRTDFDKASIQAENVWGVDDESLFNNAIKIFDENIKTNQPFFAHIMTTSNHRPFTFPAGKVDLPQGHREGAVKYTDYALGKLIENAKTKPWFKDTLFVIVADHCASVAGKTKLPVDKYHIPLIFYAPDMLPAGHYMRMASQIDIVPTLLDLLGVKGGKHFYGEALFEEAKNQAAPRAFISNYQELGYYKNDTLIVLSPKQKVEAYKVDPISLDSTPTQVNETLLKEAIAYYQTASRAYKHGDFKEDKNLN